LRRCSEGAANPVEIYLRVLERLSMGEVLSDIIERQVVTGADPATLDAREDPHAYGVIVSQDCDLEQDARARGDATMDDKQRYNALVPNVLLLVASDVQTMRAKAGVSSRQWERVKENKEERFHYLSGVSSSEDERTCGVPALLLDFKRFFTFPTDELLARISCGEVKRRARLATPYAEHLAVRFGFFFQRVGLTREHHDAERERASNTGPPALPPDGGDS
jgi:hypothetical protein